LAIGSGPKASAARVPNLGRSCNARPAHRVLVADARVRETAIPVVVIRDGIPAAFKPLSVIAAPLAASS
jgi:hypothetical protein